MAAGLCWAQQGSHARDAGMPGAGTRRSRCPGALPAAGGDTVTRHSRSAAGGAGKGRLWGMLVYPRSGDAGVTSLPQCKALDPPQE